MRTRNAVLTLLLLTFLGFGRLQSQIAFHLSYDSLNFPTPSTQVFNDTVRYNFTMTNLTGSTFSDSLYINLRTTLGTFRIKSLSNVVIPAFGSVPIAVTDTTSALRYGGGVNIIVIWPTAPNPILTDSIVDTLTIITVNLEPGADDAPSVDVFPVPARQEIFFRSREELTPIVSTELWDIHGRKIYSYSGLPTSITTSDWDAGVYFVHIQDSGGRMLRLKVVKY